MIIEGICNILFSLLDIIISFIPNGYTVPDWGVSFFALIKIGLFFFPADVLVTVVSVVTSNFIAQFLWSIIEWVYKKFPGIN